MTGGEDGEFRTADSGPGGHRAGEADAAAAAGTGPRAREVNGLVARRAVNVLRDREGKGKGISLALADAQGGKAITIQNTESPGNQFNLLFRLSFPFQQKRKGEKKSRRKIRGKRID